jgi:hypothetical protein
MTDNHLRTVLSGDYEVRSDIEQVKKLDVVRNARGSREHFHVAGTLNLSGPN